MEESRTGILNSQVHVLAYSRNAHSSRVRGEAAGRYNISSLLRVGAVRARVLVFRRWGPDAARRHVPDGRHPGLCDSNVSMRVPKHVLFVVQDFSYLNSIFSTTSPLATVFILTLSAARNTELSVMLPSCLIASYLGVFSSRLLSEKSYFSYNN